jgi:hypothetical protein
MNMDNYLNERIENMFLNKIFHFNSTIKNNFKIRHKTNYPELTRQVIQKAIRDLKVWRHLLAMLPDDNIKWNIKKQLDEFKIK